MIDKIKRIRYKIKALLLWESISDKSFKIENFLDTYLLYYTLYISNFDYIPWEEFLSKLDENEEYVHEFNKVIERNSEYEKLFSKDDGDDGKPMSVRELYATLVLSYGIPPKYVLNEIEFCEIDALVKYGYLKSKEEWEIGRLITYMTAQVNSKKKLKLKDIIEFPWESQKKEEDKPINMPIEDLRDNVSDILQQMKMMENVINQ